jgi:hypothetical protein
MSRHVWVTLGNEISVFITFKCPLPSLVSKYPEILVAHLQQHKRCIRWVSYRQAVCVPSKYSVVPVLNYLNTTAWGHMGSRCIDLHFLDLGTSWRWVVSFTPRPLYSRCLLDNRLGGPQSQSGRRGEERILDPNGTRTPTVWSSSP